MLTGGLGTLLRTNKSKKQEGLQEDFCRREEIILFMSTWPAKNTKNKKFWISTNLKNYSEYYNTMKGSREHLINMLLMTIRARRIKLFRHLLKLYPIDKLKELNKKFKKKKLILPKSTTITHNSFSLKKISLTCLKNLTYLLMFITLQDTLCLKLLILMELTFN